MVASSTAADKASRRRAELSAAAVATLAARGYANTSLRDIAANSAYSHGIFHYYFDGKDDLIRHCVRTYKTRCARSYDVVLETAQSAEELLAGYGDALRNSLTTHLGLHRLWYDLRTQTLFDSTFAEDVRLIDTMLTELVWNLLTRYAELTESQAVVDVGGAYAIMDGVFERAVLDASAGDDLAADQLVIRATHTLPGLVRPSGDLLVEPGSVGRTGR